MRMIRQISRQLPRIHTFTLKMPSRQWTRQLLSPFQRADSILLTVLRYFMLIGCYFLVEYRCSLITSLRATACYRYFTRLPRIRRAIEWYRGPWMKFHSGLHAVTGRVFTVMTTCLLSDSAAYRDAPISVLCAIYLLIYLWFYFSPDAAMMMNELYDIIPRELLRYICWTHRFRLSRYAMTLGEIKNENIDTDFAQYRRDEHARTLIARSRCHAARWNTTVIAASASLVSVSRLATDHDAGFKVK